LADYYLSVFTSKYEKTSLKLTGTAYDALMDYHWSGNIRELKHTIEKAVILCDSTVIKPADLYLKEVVLKHQEVESIHSLSDIEKSAIVRILEKCKGNITQAAKILDISRTTLYTKMKEYHI
jgi:transcriptional regulator of acetoin/glycerol metabolism